MKNNQYCVIGLGRFGQAAFEKLIELNKKVILIDENQEIINSLEIKNVNAYVLNAANEDSLKSLGIDKCSNIIIGIGSDIEASILICSILIDFNIPNIVVKANDDRHEKILRKIGVTNIIRTERSGGVNAALRCVYDVPFDFSKISDKYSIFNIEINNPKIVNKNLGKLSLPSRFLCNIILIKREEKIIFPAANVIIELHDDIYFAAKNTDVEKIINYLTISTKDSNE